MLNRTQLEKYFTTGYNRDNWLEIIKSVSREPAIFKKPENLGLKRDIAKHGYQLGTFETSDRMIIGIFEIELVDNIQIERNRVGLRNLLRAHYKPVDGCFAVYFTGNKWRFSYISETSVKDDEGNRVESKTEPKRYTFLLGEGETVRTAIDRFEELFNSDKQLEDIKEAFSVEKLNKEFFDKYRNFYKQFWTYLANDPNYNTLLENKKETNEDKRLKPIRDFVKILLGRIVFIYFLQKKGWMGCEPKFKKWINGDPDFLRNLYNNFNNKDKFHSQCLIKLFFDTLNNKERGNFIFDFTGTKIPYLNGGLFEDDFPKSKKVDFPADYFRDLFDFFGQYNFTIDESNPYDQEVGIDPEMLGHIFENLLEENKEKGVFYTPKEIVHYMCQESLVQYLYTHFGVNPAIDNFIRNENIGDRLDRNNFIIKNAKTIEDLLDNIKVCDPAIGSGAFPMGILQEILKAKSNLDLTLDRAIAKRHILQNSIYGVDIESGAVDIARLRFWLALVVDEDEPTPLPNLDFKIMQGNSLLESYNGIDLSNVLNTHKTVKLIEPEKDLFGNVKDPQISFTDYKIIEENDLQQLTEEFFNEIDPLKKQEIKETINKIVHEHIDYNLELRLLSLTRQLNEAKQQDNSKNERVLSKINEMMNERESIRDYRKRLHEIQNTKEKPFFLWHLFFSKVFEENGFDIVIGNPPYRQIQKMGKEGKILEKGGYDTFSLTGDIYCLFYELGNRLLKQDGILIFITSNKWMSSGYGKKLRKFLLEKTNPLLLIDFSKTVIFPAAVVFVNILEYKKTINVNQLMGVKAQNDYQIHMTNLNKYISEKRVLLTDLSKDSWSVADKIDLDIARQIEKKGIQLQRWDVNFFAGIKTSFNEAFHIPKEVRNKLIQKDPNSEKIIKPLLRGKDIKRWSYDFKEMYLINSHNGIKNYGIPRVDVEKNYPAIYEYLLQFYDENSPLAITNDDGTISTLKSRQDQGDHWTNLRNCAFIQEFEKPKIIWIEISDRANYCLDTEGHYLTNSAYFLTGANLKYIMGVLNSKLIDFYFFQKTAQIAGGRKRYTKQYIELLPIARIKKEQMKPFEILVDYLTFLNDKTKPSVNPFEENKSISPVFEDVLNMMVYQLYFEEHMIENGIDVLQFCDFIDIGELNEILVQKNIIGKEYSKLQEQSNPIRNRIIQANIKSKDIIRRINSSIN